MVVGIAGGVRGVRGGGGGGAVQAAGEPAGAEPEAQALLLELGVRWQLGG